MRTCIAGGPRTGKTTHALELGMYRGLTPRHTDDLIRRVSWSGSSLLIAEQWIPKPGPWIIEGVAVARSLRKWLAANPTGKPCDEIVVLEVPHVTWTSRQLCMAKSCATVLELIEAELVRRGVVIRRGLS